MPLIRRYLEEHPYLADCDVLEVNCLGMGDPHHDPKLRDHTGRHPTTMAGMAKYVDEWELTEFAIKFEQWLNNPEQDLLILPICRRERHRSVGFRTLILQWLKARFPDGAILIREGPEAKFSRHMCRIKPPKPAIWYQRWKTQLTPSSNECIR